MKEATPAAGKKIPLDIKKKILNNNKGSVQTTSQEMEDTLANRDKSPPKKKKPTKPSTFKSVDLFEAATAGGSRDVSMLLSKFAEVLRERAAADSAQMKDLEGILTEARNLESYLKERKSQLRQTLVLISDKLQS